MYHNFKQYVLTGEAQADALISYLDYLKVDYTGLCFIGCDATPTNTGYKVIKPVPKTG